MNIIRFTYASLAMFWGAFIFLTLLIYSKDNPIRFKYELHNSIRTLFPQGWAFFTKSPREENIQVYQLIDGKLQPIAHQRQATLENWMGFRRSARAISVEYAYLLYNVPSDRWTRCETDVETYINTHTLPTVSVVNATPEAFLQGEYYLVQKGIVPWAWAKHASQINLPASILKLNVLCKR